MLRKIRITLAMLFFAAITLLFLDFTAPAYSGGPGCNQCSHHCPQRINIPRELQKIDKFVEKLKRDEL